MNKLTEVFCDIDDFCHVFMPEWEKQLLTDGTRQRNRRSRLTMSDSARKVVYLAIMDASKKWTMPIRNWKTTKV